MGRHSSAQVPANTAASAPVADSSDTTAYAASSAPITPRLYGAIAAVVAAASLGAVAMTAGTDTPAFAAASTNRVDINTNAPVFQRSFDVTVDGKTVSHTTELNTWAAALAEAGVTYSAEDIVSVPLAGTPTDGADVTIQRVTVETEVQETTDEYETVREEDPELAKGKEEVRTEGRDGQSRTTYEVRYIDGEEVSREMTMDVTIAERVDEVIAVGTKEPEPEPAPAAPSSSSSNSSSNSSSTSASPAPATPAPAAEPVQVTAGGSKGIAQQMVAAKGWSSSEFQCLEILWQRESGWNHLAMNPSSGAYGIPQSLPGSKMASHGADWRTNPATQIAWGLDYIQGRYGTPCNALNHSYARGWY